MKTKTLFANIFADTALLTIFALASLFAVVRVGMAPRDPASGVAVVFSPWTGAELALARATDAGSRFVRFGAYPFIVVVIPDGDDYAARIYRDGALMVLDPQAIASCFSPAKQTPEGGAV